MPSRPCRVGPPTVNDPFPYCFIELIDPAVTGHRSRPASSNARGRRPLVLPIYSSVFPSRRPTYSAIPRDDKAAPHTVTDCRETVPERYRLDLFEICF